MALRLPLVPDPEREELVSSSESWLGGERTNVLPIEAWTTEKRLSPMS